MKTSSSKRVAGKFPVRESRVREHNVAVKNIHQMFTNKQR